MPSTFGTPDIIDIHTDILIVGGGMAACGAALEAKRWAGDDVKITLVDKATMDRSGTVTMGLAAVNAYLGEQSPEAYCRMVSADLGGISRDDLVYDIGRHVDETVHLFEEWGLPVWKDKENQGVPLADGGKPIRPRDGQIMINGEGYKPLAAEAAKRALGADNVMERVFIAQLLLDANADNRVAGAVGFSVRDHTLYVFKANAVLNVAGGCVDIFSPPSGGKAKGRAWNPMWNAGSTYAMAAAVGAELTMMEARDVPARVEAGNGPMGEWLALFKADASPTAMAELVDTLSAKDIAHPEAEAWEDYLDTCIGPADPWASMSLRPGETPPEPSLGAPILGGSHGACCGIWVSGPADMAPPEWHWGYNRMTTVSGLFTAGDGVGACGHKFSSGSFAEGRIAAQEMVRFCKDHADFIPSLKGDIAAIADVIYQPVRNHFALKDKASSESAEDVDLRLITPKVLLMRLQKVMEDYVAGASTGYQTDKVRLETGLHHIQALRVESQSLRAKDLHELMRAWENHHRLWAAEAHLRHIQFREETRYPGDLWRTDFPDRNDTDWMCFVNSRYDPKTGEWALMKVPHIDIVEKPEG